MTPDLRPHPPSAPSLFRSGLTLRLALAAALSAPLWLAITWALRA